VCLQNPNKLAIVDAATMNCSLVKSRIFSRALMCVIDLIHSQQ